MWYIEPLGDGNYSCWLDDQCMNKNAGTAEQAWKWIDDYINPIDNFNLDGYKAVRKVRT